jgi:N-acetylglucosamine-6-sulfatase
VRFRDGSTLATWLDDAGYETALMGKYLVGYPGGSYVPPGWDRWIAFTPGDPPAGSRALGYYTYGYNINGVDFPFVQQETYATDFIAQKAVSFIRTASSPFFLYFTPFSPHAPAVPADRHTSAFSDVSAWRPPSYDEADVSDKPAWVRAEARLTTEKRAALDAFRLNQLRSLLGVDDAVASILRAVAEKGDLDNTIFVYMTDNGYLWGEHRLTRKSYPYEESIRTPFVVRFDGLNQTARQDGRLVLGIDVAPTLAALAGVAAPNADGTSILPLLASEDSVPWRSRFLVEGMGRTPAYCAMRTSRFAFVTYRTGATELYDLARDPYELGNLSGKAAWRDKLIQMRKGLARLCNPPPPGLSRRVLCTHAGTNGPDTVLGTPRYDILCGRDGNDVLKGAGGPDYVFAGAGRDEVFARDGERDVISCGSGRDLALVDPSDRARPSCERVRTG